MPKITFNDSSGAGRTVEAELGSTVMETAIRNNIPGIEAECGGACACATCHVYVDENADLKMAEEITFNAKVQRPGVCNAMETLLVHEAIAESFLVPMAKRLIEAGVELRGCPRTCSLVSEANAATQGDWDMEYLDLILAVKVVSSMEEAINHIAAHGSAHTEAIVTSDYVRARTFLKEVDASVVLVNASTRFNDGGELGLGAEIGISTSKLHAYGPMGLEELTTTKFIVFGDGQVRT